MKMTLWEVSDDVKEELPKLFNRTRKTMDEDVETLQKWMQKQPHLPEILDGNVVRNFLIMNKCSIEQTKQKIDLYYTVRSKIPELFENANPKLPHMRKMMDVIYLIALPKLTKNMNRVTMFKVRKYVPSNEYDFLSYYSHIINLVELRLKDDYFLGNIIILDMQNVPLEMVGKNPLNLSLKLTTIYKNVAKSPLEAIYIINYPPFVGHLLFIFQICLSRKIFERIRIIESVETLQELVGKEILPVEYGGEEKSLEELNDLTKLKFSEYEEWFDRRDSMRVDESLRPMQLKNDDVFGYYGNFRKLDVD